MSISRNCSVHQSPLRIWNCSVSDNCSAAETIAYLLAMLCSLKLESIGGTALYTKTSGLKNTFTDCTTSTTRLTPSLLEPPLPSILWMASCRPPHMWSACCCSMCISWPSWGSCSSQTYGQPTYTTQLYMVLFLAFIQVCLSGSTCSFVQSSWQ